MSQDKQSGCAPSIPIIKVHIMMPDHSTCEGSTYVSIKYSKTTTAEEVIEHIKRKKARFPHLSDIQLLADSFCSDYQLAPLNLLISPAPASRQVALKVTALCSVAQQSSPTSLSRFIMMNLKRIFSELTTLPQVAVQDEGLWWLRESHEDSIVRLVHHRIPISLLFELIA